MWKEALTKKKFIFAAVLLIGILIFAGGNRVSAEILSYSEYKAEHVQADKDTWMVESIARETDGNVSQSGDALLTETGSSVAYTFNVDKTGLYNVTVRYQAELGGSEIARSVMVNGELPFKEADYITFRRYFKDRDQEYKNQQGNQSFPSQQEVERYTDFALTGSDGFEIEPYAFYFESGVNTVTLYAVADSMYVESVTLTPVLRLPTYDEYLAGYQSYPKYNLEAIKVQAEDAVLKSSPGLFPVNDRTSPLMEPYHPSYIILNAIGGYAWRIPGQAIEWEVNAPSDGLYRIALKFKQSDVRGSFVTRTLRVNGEIPFDKANELRFSYGSDYSVEYLGDGNGNDYYFYLQKGVNTISLEASLGVFGDINRRARESLKNLNGLYQEIIMVTSSSPDKYRDYQIITVIPMLRERLTAESEKLRDLVNDISDISGSYTDSTAIIERLINNIDKIVTKPMNIASYLADFKASVSALGDYLIVISEQPLTLDYLVVAGDNYELPKAKANFFQKLIHAIRAFLGSFTTDYNSTGSDNSGKVENVKTIEVWVSTGRDQYNILKRLASESFARQYPNINVYFKLVNADVIFTSTLMGNGPDINLQVAASTPINFGYRGGAYDLTEFADFEEVAERFAPAAIETFSYKGATYALPDQMSFNMLFYRTDIFEELGLVLPKTMHEFLSIVPELQKNNMDIYFTTTPQTSLGSTSAMGSTRNLNSVYASILYQMNGGLYENEGESTRITDDIGIKAFKYWTELYTRHNFIVETNFETRFRVGEIPVGIVDFNVFNNLAVSAPEIRGEWAMAQIPGLEDENGNVRYDVPLTVSGSLIVKNRVEKKDTVNEAWEFLKWWTSEETQYNFSMEMEAVLGLAGRYPVANLKAFEKISWGQENLKVLKDSLEWAKAVPQVPGSYITGRVIENAFLSVVTASSNKNPTDALYKARDQLNAELTAKRKEFGIE